MILLVEDNPLHRKMYSAALRSHGYDPLEVEDERDAVSTAASARPSVAVIDILLPFMDGREVIAALRAEPRTRDLPILAISAAADRDIASTCIAAGADYFQPKSISLRSFIKTITLLRIGRGA